MPVYPNLKCIFVHIPKTGGQSISALLREVGVRRLADGDIELEHITVTMIQKRIQYDNFFKFTVVRDPVDRMMSEYRFSKQNNYRPYLLNSQDLSFNRFVQAVANLDLSGMTHAMANHLYPQTSFIYDGDRLLVDYVIRFENLNEGMSVVSERLGGLPPLEHLNASRPEEIECDESSLELIYKMYAEDYRLLDYKLPSSSSG